MKKKNRYKEYLLLPILSCFLFAILLLLSIVVDVNKLMGNSIYNQIQIREREKYTLNDEYVSACSSNNSNVLKTQLINGKCILTGVSKGSAEIDLFTASDGINFKTYNIIVNSYVNLNKKTRFSGKSLSFKVDTNNIHNINFNYCYLINGKCIEQSINNSSVSINNKEIRFNSINKEAKRVCLYAYDNELIDSICVDRGLFNIFW